MMIENIFNLFITKFDFIQFIELTKNDYILQGLMLCIINVIFSCILIQTRIGFSFIDPFKARKQRTVIPKNMRLALLLGYIAMCSVSAIVMYFDKAYLLLLTVSLFILITIVNFAYEKEMAE
ncbi:hypothetical protein SK3146_02056 [Paenibacillus konkukensis]|uniref:DUF3784 domain-containing protein n=1 Tax=Paenibacillus konkukensis TaxID=2020716 RepID=A0ABY4RKD0_9BACL|nr:hypothetical protein SK3146_02056 [Paenibacillus konkukensis]